MIRAAETADEPRIRACAKEAYSRYVSVIGRKPAPMNADYASLIEAGHVHVAVDPDNNLLGFVVFYEDHGNVMLENVAVFPDAAGRGVGKKLIRFCETEARQRAARAVRLYTNEKMTENLSIYPRLGYVETGRHSEDGFDRVYFEKPLS
ncbi:GNAT family N-acetyltransferase [Roseivivax sp. THAF30]|uniref:GNAT family N-acetyltransferase n=1 Tax=Roseivivax sp. THAF30 TaxID=2587852 RepID=UPI001267B5FC|nr:GNAT family N-acetyltransferase [Roseivivax sp. THAF30]QFT61795.1 putative acetyltransferase [Roseivivax sp. THAF30]